MDLKSSKKGFLMPPRPLTNFEIQKYYQNESRFNWVFSRDNLPKIKFQEKIRDWAYVIQLDEYSDIRNQWVAFYTLNNNDNCFGSFAVEHIPQQMKIFIHKSIFVTNVFRIKAYDPIMCGYFCIGVIDFLCLQERLY